MGPFVALKSSWADSIFLIRFSASEVCSGVCAVRRVRSYCSVVSFLSFICSGPIVVDAEIGFAEVSVLEGVFLFDVESVGSFLYGFGSSYVDAESRVIVGMVIRRVGFSLLKFFFVSLFQYVVSGFGNSEESVAVSSW